MAKIYNGGRSVSIGGVSVKILDGYSPQWTKEYKDSFTTWDGRIVKQLTGIRFSLQISSHSLTAEEIEQIRAALEPEEINLICDEFSGKVICESFSPQMTHSNIYCEFFKFSATFTAVEAVVTEDSGGL